MPCEKSATASGPYSALIFWSFSATTLERLVPRDRGPLLLAALLPPDERRLEAVGVEVRADAAGAARAEAAPAERVVGVALDLPELAVADVGDRAALPEADVAEGGHRADALVGAAAAPAPGASRPAAAPAAARPAVVPEIWRNRRLETVIMMADPAGPPVQSAAPACEETHKCRQGLLPAGSIKMEIHGDVGDRFGDQVPAIAAAGGVAVDGGRHPARVVVERDRPAQLLQLRRPRCPSRPARRRTRSISRSLKLSPTAITCVAGQPPAGRPLRQRRPLRAARPVDVHEREVAGLVLGDRQRAPAAPRPASAPGPPSSRIRCTPPENITWIGSSVSAASSGTTSTMKSRLRWK